MNDVTDVTHVHVNYNVCFNKLNMFHSVNKKGYFNPHNKTNKCTM